MIDKLLLTKLYYKNVLSTDYKNKENLINSFKNHNSLSLRMTCYVFEPSFKYEKIHRIRNNFNLSPMIGYYD